MIPIEHLRWAWSCELIFQIIDWEKSIVRQAERFEAGAAAGETTAPVFALIAEDMMRVEKAIFSSQGRRGGGSWKGLSDDTARRKDSNIILEDTGTLRRSVTELGAQYQILRISNLGVEFGTDRPWSFVHQFGSRTTPKREFINFTARDQTRWADMLFNHLMRPFVNNAS